MSRFRELYRYIPDYPVINSDNFYLDLFQKKEWNQLKENDLLDSTKKVDNIYLNHQLIIARFISHWTLYQSLIVLHDTGTGKSGVVAATLDGLKKHNENLKMLYITNNTTLYENFKNELFKFSKYIKQKNSENLNPSMENWNSKRNKFLSKIGIEFSSFGVFANAIKNGKTSLRDLQNKWENQLIVMDEIHHLITFDIDTKEVSIDNRDNRSFGQDTYNLIQRFIYSLSYKKLLLMTATPMRDQPEEIAYLFNLVLPPSQKFQVGDEFVNEYFITTRQTIQLTENLFEYNWKKDKQFEFLNKIKGYVSVLKQNVNVKIIYKGFVIPPMKHCHIFPLIMSSHQNKGYIKASEQSEDRDFYNALEQASLFVFPNLEYGKTGFITYMDKKTFRFLDSFKEISQMKPFSVKPFTHYSDSDRDILNYNLQILKQYSIIYFQIINELLHYRHKKQYIYSDKITGSGIQILIALLKQFFGYEIFNVSDHIPNIPRFLFLHEYAGITDKEISEYIKKFNQEDNFKGVLCQVVIGTDKTKEGISLLEIEKIHICTPDWNFGKINQAIGRGIRYGSHHRLIEPIVEIFFYCAIQNSNDSKNSIIKISDTHIQHYNHLLKEKKIKLHIQQLINSINFYQYFRSEIKDINIKLIEYSLLIGSVDCSLNKSRNDFSSFENGSKNCFYRSCHYKCFGVEDIDISSLPIESINYDLYYMNEKLESYITIIQQICKYRLLLHLNEINSLIQQKYPNTSLYHIINTIQIIIDTPIPIIYYDGRQLYLYRYKDLLYLSDNRNLKVEDPNNLFLTIYSEYPYFKLIQNFDSLQQNIYLRFQKYISHRFIQSLYIFDSSYQELFLNNFHLFPIQYQLKLIDNILHLNPQQHIQRNLDLLQQFQILQSNNQDPHEFLFRFKNYKLHPQRLKWRRMDIPYQDVKHSVTLVFKKGYTHISVSEPRPTPLISSTTSLSQPPSTVPATPVAVSTTVVERSILQNLQGFYNDKREFTIKDLNKIVGTKSIKHQPRGKVCSSYPVYELCHYILRLSKTLVPNDILKERIIIQIKEHIISKSIDEIQTKIFQILQEVQNPDSNIYPSNAINSLNQLFEFIFIEKLKKPDGTLYPKNQHFEIIARELQQITDIEYLKQVLFILELCARSSLRGAGITRAHLCSIIEKLLMIIDSTPPPVSDIPTNVTLPPSSPPPSSITVTSPPPSTPPPSSITVTSPPPSQPPSSTTVTSPPPSQPPSQPTATPVSNRWKKPLGIKDGNNVFKIIDNIKNKNSVKGKICTSYELYKLCYCIYEVSDGLLEDSVLGDRNLIQLKQTIMTLNHLEIINELIQIVDWAFVTNGVRYKNFNDKDKKNVKEFLDYCLINTHKKRDGSDLSDPEKQMYIKHQIENRLSFPTHQQLLFLIHILTQIKGLGKTPPLLCHILQRILIDRPPTAPQPPRPPTAPQPPRPPTAPRPPRDNKKIVKNNIHGEYKKNEFRLKDMDTQKNFSICDTKNINKLCSIMYKLSTTEILDISITSNIDIQRMIERISSLTNEQLRTELHNMPTTKNTIEFLHYIYPNQFEKNRKYNKNDIIQRLQTVNPPITVLIGKRMLLLIQICNGTIPKEALCEIIEKLLMNE